jgi:hypothetical protein
MPGFNLNAGDGGILAEKVTLGTGVFSECLTL